ncbi:MAG: sulfatase-like hydrolase/transferase [Chloroflexota bacterium]|nr:sulfatase-like hydrolase/transferase [Chloroflexota bacterium]
MTQPNIVLIVADDMGYGDFGIFNDGPARTPILDGLADESMCLTQHYSGSCVCAPARAALMTGRYPHRTGAIDTLEGQGLDRLALREVTLADHLRAAGYATGMVGKWHLGALDPRYHPNARGFDDFFGFRGGWADYYKWRIDRNGTTEHSDGRYLTDVFAAEASAFIERHAQRPFFLHVAFNAPHTPLQAPQELVQPYLDAGLAHGVALIYAMNERMDAGVGQILDALDRTGCADNTVVMFTSDNGPQLSHGFDYTMGIEVDTHRFNCNFNGAKGNVFEGGIRVPMLVRWPEGLPAGQRNDALVHYVDWLPTLIEAAGVSRVGGRPIDGVSVLPALRGEIPAAAPRRYWQWNRYTPQVECNAAIRNGRWKLVRPRITELMSVRPEHTQMDRDLKYRPDLHAAAIPADIPERDFPPLEAPMLFDLEIDPGEQNDLSNTEPQRAARLLGELESLFEEVEAERLTIAD